MESYDHIMRQILLTPFVKINIISMLGNLGASRTQISVPSPELSPTLRSAGSWPWGQKEVIYRTEMKQDGVRF